MIAAASNGYFSSVERLPFTQRGRGEPAFWCTAEQICQRAGLKHERVTAKRRPRSPSSIRGTWPLRTSSEGHPDYLVRSSAHGAGRQAESIGDDQ